MPGPLRTADTPPEHQAAAHQNRLAPHDRKAGGVYYTPEDIVAYMVEHSLGRLVSGKSPDQILALRIVNTSCGAGAFLIGAFGYLMQALLAIYRTNPDRAGNRRVEIRDGELHLTVRHKLEILGRCIYGVNIDPQAVVIARLSLYRKLMEDESTFGAPHRQVNNDNIVVGNSLATLDGDGELFPDVLRAGGFDLVIGNPPYIKEYVNKSAFDHVRTSRYFQGKMDLWYLFACHGLDWLKPETGLLALIATNNWLTNFGAKKLREKITREARIDRLIDFGDYKVFGDAGVQTMILIVRRTAEPRTYTFDYRRLTSRKPSQGDARALLQKQTNDNSEYLTPTFNRGRPPQSPLTFADSSSAALLDRIEARRNFELDGRREIAQGIVPNIDVVSARNISLIPMPRRRAANIAVGDGVFVVDARTFPSPTVEERAFLKSLYDPTDVDRYAVVKKTSRRIIYSSKAALGGGTLPARLVQHLKKYREIMRERRENKTGQIDDYHLHWPRDPRVFEPGPKILCVRKCEAPTFAYTEDEAYVMMAFNVIRTDRIDNLFLTGLLNSRLVRFWLRHKGKMQGNNFQLDKEPILAIPICAPVAAEQARIGALVRRVIEARSAARSSAEQVQLSRLIAQWDDDIQNSIEAIYGVAGETLLQRDRR